ncbi:MAG: D-alanine--poly(phosphoribitol) ligase subunit 2 [Clostridia bacterium]|nr:D-alanine--poly(phosphoribitol) ligase subunit 2 [Clostridia bacterium]
MDYKKLALEILENVCETDELDEEPDMDLFDAGLMDSLSSINILLEIEKNLGMKLQVTDIDKSDISTVNNFESFLRKRSENN